MIHWLMRVHYDGVGGGGLNTVSRADANISLYEIVGGCLAV